MPKCNWATCVDRLIGSVPKNADGTFHQQRRTELQFWRDADLLLPIP